MTMPTLLRLLGISKNMTRTGPESYQGIGAIYYSRLNKTSTGTRLSSPKRPQTRSVSRRRPIMSFRARGGGELELVPSGGGAEARDTREAAVGIARAAALSAWVLVGGNEGIWPPTPAQPETHLSYLPADRSTTPFPS